MRPPGERSLLVWWDGKVRSLLFDLLVAGLVLAPASTHGALADPRVAGVAGVAFLAVWARRRWPEAAVAATVGLSLLAGPSFALLVALYTVAGRRGPTVSTWLGAVLAGATMLVGFLRGGPVDPLVSVLGPVLYVSPPVLLGLWRFQRRELLAGLRERAEQAERERDLLAERAVTAERRRIAREMHDVVAHRVGLIALQAGALSVTAPDERTERVAEVIRETGATALDELRDMLRVLRDDPQPAGQTGPEPMLAAIGSLVGAAVAAGGKVDLEFPEPLSEPSPIVGRAAYRVVQEALTNAAKHAPDTPVRVVISAERDGLAVEVTNPPGHDTAPFTVPTSGYGLIGMRERVTLADGVLHAARTDDGGYRVRAVFPLSLDQEGP